jgi:uncharacterized protein YjiS (DUF1127 family)
MQATRHRSDQLHRKLPALLGHAAGQTASTVAGIFRRVIALRVQRSTAVTLNALDDRMLRDIGMTREDIPRVARDMSVRAARGVRSINTRNCRRDRLCDLRSVTGTTDDVCCTS